LLVLWSVFGTYDEVVAMMECDVDGRDRNVGVFLL